MADISAPALEKAMAKVTMLVPTVKRIDTTVSPISAGAGAGHTFG